MINIRRSISDEIYLVQINPLDVVLTVDKDSVKCVAYYTFVKTRSFFIQHEFVGSAYFMFRFRINSYEGLMFVRRIF